MDAIIFVIAASLTGAGGFIAGRLTSGATSLAYQLAVTEGKLDAARRKVIAYAAAGAQRQAQRISAAKRAGEVSKQQAAQRRAKRMEAADCRLAMREAAE